MGATADRVFSVLALFTVDQPEWTVEAIASHLGLSASTAYLDVGSLVKAGFLVSAPSGAYRIGPAAIELDRTVRLTDPLTRHGRSVLRELVRNCDEKATGLTCRLYRLRVMCVDQYSPNPPNIESSYERGRPMPLFRGAASKVILANLPARSLRPMFDRETEAFVAAGLGPNWEAFKEQMRIIRRDRSLAIQGELDVGAMGISAPVFGEDKTVLGSIGLVIEAAPALANPAHLKRLKDLVADAGEAASAALRRDSHSQIPETIF